MLPDIDGYSICETLKLERETNRIPIIMTTALSGHEDKVRGLQVGADRYVTKPFTGEQLNHLLGSLFLFSGLTPPQIRQLTTAVRELGTNAIEWGHQKQVDRIVTV